MEHLKKFNDINEGYKSSTGVEIPQSIMDTVDELLKELKSVSADYLEDKLTSFSSDDDEISNSQVSFKIRVPLERTFQQFIYRYVQRKNIKKKYNFEIDPKTLTSRSFMITFFNKNNGYQMPLITTVSGGDMIYRNELEFTIWINRYVTKRVDSGMEKLDYEPWNEE